MPALALERKTPSWIRRVSTVVAITMLCRLVGFLYPVLVLRQLNNTAAGLAFFFINSAYFVVQPVSGGPAMAMVRPIAAAATDSERSQWLRAAAAITVPAVMLALIVALTVCITSGAPALPMLLMVVGLSADAMYFQILTARHRYVAAATYRLIANIGQLAVLVFVLALGFRSVTLVVGIFALSYSVGFAAVESHQRILIDLVRHATSATRAQHRTLMTTAIPTVLTGLAYAGIIGLDTYLVRLANRDLVAGYGAAKTLAAPFLLISLAVTTIIQPETARANLTSAITLRRRILLLGTCGGAIAIAICWAFSGTVVAMVYGTRYPEATMTLRWLGTGTTLLGLHTLLQMWCWGRGRYVAPLISLGTGAIAAIGCNVLLVPHFGTRGAGLAVCFGAAIATGLLVVISRPVTQRTPLDDCTRSARHDLPCVTRILTPTKLRTMSRAAIALLLITFLATWGGYVVAYVGSIPLWPLLAICLMGLAIASGWRTSLIHPMALFPTLYLIYFLLGSQNWADRAGYTTFRTFIDTDTFLRLPVLGLAAYMCGVSIISYKTAALRTHAYAFASKTASRVPSTPDLLRRTGILLGLIGLVGAAGAIVRHGILITDPEARAGGLGQVGIFAYVLIPAGVLLAATANSRSARVAIVAGVSLLLLATVGFRITVVILVLTYLVFKSMWGHLRARNIVIGVVSLTILAFAVNSYRLDRNGDASVYGTIIVPTHILADVPALTSLYYSIPHEGVAVFNDLVTLVPTDHPFMDGRLQLAALETAIPHSIKKIDSRGIVTQLVYGTSAVPTSLTPTILGGPYVDFGIIGVMVEMGLLGIFLAYLYQRSKQSASAIPSLAYAYFLSVTVAGIHTGILDIQFEVIVPASTGLALWLCHAFSRSRGGSPEAQSHADIPAVGGRGTRLGHATTGAYDALDVG